MKLNASLFFCLFDTTKNRKLRSPHIVSLFVRDADVSLLRDFLNGHKNTNNISQNIRFFEGFVMELYHPYRVHGLLNAYHDRVHTISFDIPPLLRTPPL